MRPDDARTSGRELRRSLSALVAVLALLLPATAAADGWSSAGSMGAAHRQPVSVLLPDGTVLVVGGLQSSPIADVERYDPATNTWATGAQKPPDMSIPRAHPAVALLPDGRVLVAGGSTTGFGATKTTEIYVPGTNTWLAGPDMAAARRDMVSATLANGDVLVAGGFNLSSAERYDPLLNAWSSAGSMSTIRTNATATLLSDGHVLVAGGQTQLSPLNALKSADLYDPVSNTWATGFAKPPDMNGVRFNAVATLLPNGDALVVGGADQFPDNQLKTVERYHPATNTWASGPDTPQTMAVARDGPAIALLPSGKALVAGGFDDSAELFDPATSSWSSAASMAASRQELPSATTLCDGRVLVTGGFGGFNALASAELYSSGFALPLSGNLLINGDAEQSGFSGAAPTVNGIAAPPGWAVTPNLTAVGYGSPGGFPSLAVATAIGGGVDFFAGGPSTPSSTACQTADVRGAAATIDAHRTSATLAGDLGGFGSEGDDARVQATFLDAVGHALGSEQIGPVTADNRANQTTLLARTATADLPAGTRSIRVLVTMTRTNGGYDDAYADNLSLNLTTKPAPGGPSGAGSGAAAPRLSGLAIKPSTFRAAGRGAHASRRAKRRVPVGTTISYRDSQAATTTFTVLRATRGARVGHRCVKPTRATRRVHARRCTRLVGVGHFRHRDVAGRNRLSFSGRLGRHALAPGAFRLHATPRNSARKTGRTASVSFRVVR